MRKALSVAAALVALVLAGCAGEGGGTADTNDIVDDEDFQDYEATEDTGVIRGVVIDEAVRPIIGAEVSLTVTGGNKTTTTSDSGAFGFAGLEPGTYFLEASKLGFNTVQASTEVVAGDSEPPITRILLTADPSSLPYVSATQYSGYIECSFRVGAPGGNPSVGVNACNGVGNQDVNMPLGPFDKEPDFVQGEMVWQSTQTLGSGLSFVVGPPGCRDVKYARADGASPLVIGMNKSHLLNESAEAEEDGFDAEAGICYRAFSWVAAETQSSIGVVTSQQFEVFYHVFYGFEPEEGWNFSEDGDPPLPE